MKKLSIVLLLLFSCSARLAAQKSSDYIKDFHLDEDIYCFNISHTGKLNYNPLNEPEINERGGLLFCPGRFDWIMPSDGSYAYSEGTGIMSLVLGSPLPTSGFLEMGYGWMFNNKRASKSNKFVTVQYGMGVGFGFRQFYLESKKEGTLYGLLWPEFSSIISVGDRLEIVPKLIFNPIFSGNEWGLRTGSEAMFIYRLMGKFSLTGRVMRESFNFNEKFDTDKGEFSGKAKSTSFQFGFAINVSSLKSKYKRD
ncbi:MAG: hypothetical protein RL135_2516 [Bacteroidota bacterium]|jgi:hypothetical protein